MVVMVAVVDGGDGAGSSSDDGFYDGGDDGFCDGGDDGFCDGGGIVIMFLAMVRVLILLLML